MWPWDERIERALNGYRGLLLQETIEKWKTPDEIQLEYLLKHLPEFLKKIFDIIGVSIINTIVNVNPFVKRKRRVKTIFQEKGEGGEIRVVNGKHYRIVE